MTRKELESALEARCVKRIEDLGGLALKLRPPTGRGFLDRTILMPPGRPPWWAEFKRSGTGEISAQQHQWARDLMTLGYGAYFPDTDADFETALKRELNR